MKTKLYVAPVPLGRQDGSAPEHAMSDLAAAVEAARTCPGPVQICMESGHYCLSRPLRLDERDNGLQFVGQDAAISSGIPVTGWREEGQGIISAPVDPRIHFNRLYVNGAARERTRWPETGHFETKQVVKRASLWLADMTPEQRQIGKRTMFFYSDDIPKQLYRQEDVDFVILQYWMDTHGAKIEHIDHEKGEIIFREEAARPYCWSFGYYMENVREGLNVPGRWYRDLGENRLYYHLQPGESLDTLLVTRPVLSTLIETAPSQGRAVEDLLFEGICFCQTDAHPEGQQHIFPQAELTAPVAVKLENVQNCRFDRCAFTQLGGYGLWIRGDSRNCAVDRCEFTFCGAGAVRIGETRRANGLKDIGTSASYNAHAAEEARPDGKAGKTEFISVTNCLVADCGWFYHGSAGIWVGQAGHCTVSHNDISGPLQWAISVGWVWDIFPLNQTIGNRVEKNFIHELGTGILGTHGAIYLLGVSPNTCVDGNYICNIYSTPYWGGGEGIILDNCCSGITVQNNLVVRASAGGWGCNFDCFGNIIRNNIFCFGEKFQLTRYGDPPKGQIPPPNGEIFSQNILLWEEGPLFGEADWLSFSTFWDYNLYWRIGSEPDFMGRTFEQWQALGLDTHSLVADPLFTDSKNGDFSLRPDSPAFSLGFEPFSIADAGIQV